jgi:hypothetical protein
MGSSADGRTDGRQWQENMAASGEIRWPPPGRNRWPLTVQQRSTPPAAAPTAMHPAPSGSCVSRLAIARPSGAAPLLIVATGGEVGRPGGHRRSDGCLARRPLASPWAHAGSTTAAAPVWNLVAPHQWAETTLLTCKRARVHGNPVNVSSPAYWSAVAVLRHTRSRCVSGHHEVGCPSAPAVGPAPRGSWRPDPHGGPTMQENARGEIGVQLAYAGPFTSAVHRLPATIIETCAGVTPNRAAITV